MEVYGSLCVFAVEGLISAAVNSYADIDRKHNEGTKNRTVAATNMNASSRCVVLFYHPLATMASVLGRRKI